jgi:hypothetical protein
MNDRGDSACGQTRRKFGFGSIGNLACAEMATLIGTMPQTTATTSTSCANYIAAE